MIDGRAQTTPHPTLPRKGGGFHSLSSFRTQNPPPLRGRVGWGGLEFSRDHHWAVYPPSMNSVASDARKTTAGPSSSGSPQRPRGILASQTARTAGSFRSTVLISVLNG